MKTNKVVIEIFDVDNYLNDIGPITIHTIEEVERLYPPSGPKSIIGERGFMGIPRGWQYHLINLFYDLLSLGWDKKISHLGITDTNIIVRVPNNNLALLTGIYTAASSYICKKCGGSTDLEMVAVTSYQKECKCGVKK